ncbi:sugar phosphate isomerase/epimerase [bacterium]|nr:sugar phosphate isomerase/epimerase [bacterium]
MKTERQNKRQISRREFLGSAAAAAALTMVPLHFRCASQNRSDFGGVQIGAITYSFRSMPGSAEEILDYCVRAGIGSIELMSPAAEEYAGIPASPTRPRRERGVELSAEEQAQYDAAMAEYQTAREAAAEEQRKWRLSPPMEKFEALRKMYNNEGVNIHIVKFSPARWSDEEIDYAFNAAKAMGAYGVTDELGDEACNRLGSFAVKHGMYAIYHNHRQAAEPGFSYDPYLAYSPANMLNFDAGHYFGCTGLDPIPIIEKYHDRIFSIHLKDLTAPDADPPETIVPWGQGGTPLADVLLLVQKQKWPIYCDIELEYPIPQGSDAVEEVKKCVEYCKNVLV